MEGSAAIAAEFSNGVGYAQPVTASRALRIDALHCPSRQIQHAFPPVDDALLSSHIENILGSR